MNPVAYAPAPEPDYQARQDADHLKMLSIFYYVVAGLLGLSGLIGVFYMFMGLMFVNLASAPTSTIAVTPNTFPGVPTLPPTTSHSAPPPPEFGWIFVGLGAFMTLAFAALAIFTVIAGRSITRREKKTLIQVVAGILCLNVPVGTALGVCTFIVLGRPSVAALFEAPRSP